MRKIKQYAFFSYFALITEIIFTAGSCGGDRVSHEDVREDDQMSEDDKQEQELSEIENMEEITTDEVEHQDENMPDDFYEQVADDEIEVIEDADGEEGSSGMVDELGTNNQNIAGVERVIFLGDSITASPYLTTPWSDLIRNDLRTLFGNGVEFHNYAAWGAKTEDVRDDQLPRIDTGSAKKTLILMTVGGNDALQVIGQPADASLAHMQGKIAILREIIQWILDPAHFPGGVYLVFANIYDPTDGVGDFTHCGVGTAYEDWPDLPAIEPVANGWYLDLAMEFGVDMLDMHGLFLGHGYHNNDPSNPWYCHNCTPDCPCPRWFDFTCIHPNSDGHSALAQFFYRIITR